MTNADGSARVPRNETMQDHGIVLLATPQSIGVTLGAHVISKEQEIIHAP